MGMHPVPKDISPRGLKLPFQKWVPLVSLHPSMSDPMIPVLLIGKLGFRVIKGPAEEFELGSDLTSDPSSTWLEVTNACLASQ